MVDLALTDEQAAFRSSVRAFVDDTVTPYALQNDREERFPDEAFVGLRKNGYLGLTIPEDYGGGGADPLSYVLMIEELGAHYGTDRVAAEVSWPGAAASVAVEPGQRIGAAALQRAA